MWDIRPHDVADHSNFYRAKYYWLYRARNQLKAVHFTNHKIWHSDEIRMWTNLTQWMLNNDSGNGKRQLSDYHEQILLEFTVLYWYYSLKGQLLMRPEWINKIMDVPEYVFKFVNLLMDEQFTLVLNNEDLNLSTQIVVQHKVLNNNLKYSIQD
jgi:hypothetical protein